MLLQLVINILLMNDCHLNNPIQQKILYLLQIKDLD